MKMKTIYTVLFILGLLTSSVVASAQNEKKDKDLILTLTSSNYAEETSKGLVLVDFWAPWCGPCRRMAPVLDEISKEYKGQVIIAKLNVDNYKKFAISKGIEALPTIVVYKEGKEVTRITGLAKKEELIKTIEKYNAK